MQPAYLDVSGHRIRYAEAGTGTPLILVHGITGYLEDWAANIDTLAQHHRVFALDLLGSGKSDKPDDLAYTQEQIARSILDFMDAAGIDKAHLAGYSSGGRQVLLATHLAPERVLSITALAPAGFAKSTIINFRLATVPGLGEILTKPSRGGTKMLMKTAVHDPAVLTDALLDHKYQMQREPGAQRIFLRTLRDFVGFRGFHDRTWQTARSWLPGIAQPVMLIWGRNDKFLSFEHAQVVQDGLRDVRFHAYDACGHLPQLEHPERFNRDLLAFLSEVDARAA